MVDFLNVGNTVEININTDETVIIVPRLLNVFADDKSPFIYIDEDINAKTKSSYLKFNVLDINGRPSDDTVEVAQ